MALGWFDRFKRQSVPTMATSPPMIHAAAIDSTNEIAHTYENRNITFNGDLSSYDYDSILRDKQRNIYSLFELSDYYIDKDPIYRGIVRGVYSTFSMSEWKLIGANEKTKQKYEEYYRRINLRDRMASIFYQYFKYGNVYVYLMDDGNIITLPVHKVRITNMMLNGEPVIEFNAQSVSTDIFMQGAKAAKDYIDDESIKERLRGYPPEVAEAVTRGDQWVQLNPENTFVLQDLKEDWMRYAIPLIAPCLTGLAKKAKIAQWETTILNLCIASFIHVRYGNDRTDDPNLMPNREELTMVQTAFSKAMKGSALAVTNNYAKAEVIQPDIQDLFEFDKYKYVNSEILSAGGISGIVVSGRADDGSTFASAQVSMNTADKRIELARDNFCEMMNKINRRINGGILPHSSTDKVPMFTFVPIDLSGNGKFQKTCYELWKDGCVSTETLLKTHGFDFKQEVALKDKEIKDGTYNLLNVEKEQSVTDSASTGDATEAKKIGRPEVDPEERTSDMGKSVTGKQPKPSNPEGSMDE